MDDCQLFVATAYRIKKKMDKEFTKEHQGGSLTPAENFLLETISLNKDVTVNFLGQRLGYNKSLVTKNMKALLDQGYVVTRNVDGRTLAINVTPKGLELVKIGKIKRELFVEEVFKDFAPEEKDQFMAAIRRLNLD